MAEVKNIMREILAGVMKAVKVTVFYIVPSILIALLTSTEFRDMITETPQLAAYANIINFILITIANVLKERTHEDSIANTVL